ncbi:MAG: LacI family DNA-binding transcriptional regulator [Eubacteriales bacterium]|nr:LacI family DNA-binding transcriptional regulator [Eubacteriales bacterium]
MKQNVNMRGIGRALGVSAVTVSKALAGRSGVSEAMREQIVRKAQELGYRYDLVPKSARETRWDVGILIADHFMGKGNSFYASMCKKLVQQLNERSCYGVLGILSEEEELTGRYPDILGGGRVNGLVILGQVNWDYIHMLESVGTNVPYICMDFYDERSNADAVVSDGLYGGYRLTSHLIHMGHTRIGFVGSIRATSSIMDRYLGYYRSMLQHDIPIDPAWIVPDRDEHGAYMEHPLPSPLPTAFVCNCDQMAVRLIRLLQSSGLRVPEDVSVVGFDDYVDEPATKPTLTTFAVDQDTMAREAAEMIIAKMQGRADRKGRVVTGGRMVYRESVRDLHPAGEGQLAAESGKC